MRRKYIVLLLVVLGIMFLLVFRNIVYAFVSNSERVDGHMLSVMVQGAVSPAKEFMLEGTSGGITIILPEGAAEIESNTFLIPRSKYKVYLESLKMRDGYTVEQLGSYIAVEVEDESLFHISVAPYTGAYMKLRYSRW